MSRFIANPRFWLISLLSVCMMLSSFTLPDPLVKQYFFQLMSSTGKLVAFSDYKDAKGMIIVFTCNHCPFAKLYWERLNRLAGKYTDAGIPLLAISSTDTVQYEEDGFAEMQGLTKVKSLNFPYLYDASQSVARQFNAQKTPHVFVLWRAGNGWTIRYNGAIDDNGAEEKHVSNHYIEQAVDALLAGRQPAITETKSIGCQIHYRKK